MSQSGISIFSLVYLLFSLFLLLLLLVCCCLSFTHGLDDADGAIILDVKEEGERERRGALSFAADRPRFVIYASFFRRFI